MELSKENKDGQVVANESTANPNQLPVERDLSAFSYEAIDASKFIHVKDWSQFFDEIPVDPYIKDGYRYKSIAWFRIKHRKASAIGDIDKHISEVNRLSGISEADNQN